jgi:aryl-alcohol dehydrogenase-like predicted oxidoreductase
MPTAQSPVYKLNNGIEMPALGLGVFRSEPGKTVSAVTSAVADGYRLIDTAAACMNEQQVGEGVRASGISREEIFVPSKLWIADHGHEQTFHAFDRSLRKLGLDFLDLYLLHWPVPSAFEATVDSYKAAVKLLVEGRVRGIGVCNFRANDLDKLIKQTGHSCGESGRTAPILQSNVNFVRPIKSTGSSPRRGLPLVVSSATAQRPRTKGRKTLSHIRQSFCSRRNTERLPRRLSCAGRSSWALLPFRNPSPPPRYPGISS